jgi:DNA-binding NtrC family response regulator
MVLVGAVKLSAQPRFSEVLWVDDEPVPGFGLLLREHGFNVEWATTGAQALQRVRERRYALVIVDVRLKDMLGLTVVKRLVGGSQVLVVTGHYLEDEIRTEAWRLGAAVAYKPFLDEEAFANALNVLMTGRGHSGLLHVPPGPSVAATDRQDLQRDGGCSRAEAAHAHGIVAVSDAMRDVLGWIAKAGPTGATVLITGETGVGKDLVATAIHRSSPRRARPARDAELRVHPRAAPPIGTFRPSERCLHRSDERSTRAGRARQRRPLFLDEIGDLPLALQAHLLRFLETGEAHRLGDSSTTRFDVRVVAATNRTGR